jgi:hypothetical protein
MVKPLTSQQAPSMSLFIDETIALLCKHPAPILAGYFTLLLIVIFTGRRK